MRNYGQYCSIARALDVVGDRWTLLISREDAPPPVATVLYALTENGLTLEPVLKALGLWGLRYMAVERPADAFQARWLAYAPAWFTTDGDPDAAPAVIQL